MDVYAIDVFCVVFSRFLAENNTRCYKHNSDTVLVSFVSFLRFCFIHFCSGEWQTSVARVKYK